MLALLHQSNITEWQKPLTYSSEQLLQAVSNGPDYICAHSISNAVHIYLWCGHDEPPCERAYYQFGGCLLNITMPHAKVDWRRKPFCNNVQIDLCYKNLVE